MKEILVPVVILVVGFGVGFVVGDDSVFDEDRQVADVHMSGEEMDDHMDDDHAHTTHEMMNLEASVAPRVDLMIHKDLKSGWNAEIITENFTFAPEHASGEYVEGEGHAHIYVDGIKINRVYGNWYHLGELESGMRTVEVRLSSNDHKELAVDGVVIADTETVEVGE